MNVSLSAEFDALIGQKVKSGLYNSASEVVREGLRLLKERDEIRDAKLTRLRSDLQKGLDDIGAGRLYDGPEAMEAIRRRLLKEKKRKNG